MLQYSFNNNKSTFFKALKEKVDNYFIERKLHRSGGIRLYCKGITQIVIAAGIYTVLVFFTPVIPVSLVLCVLLGFNLAAIGFNVMHEGGHQSFSRYAWINTISAYFLNVLGGNTYYWKIKHNVNHHTYTNVEGMDSDIDVKPFMRLHEGQPQRKYHRFQHFYWVVLYAISYLVWIFYDDFQKYFSGKVSKNSIRKNIPLREHFIFWITKLFYITIYMVLPVIVAGWLPWLIGFLIVTLVCGLSISIVFQLAHVVEGTQFHRPEADGDKQEWAIHQVVSTSNFGTSSRVLHWLLGGLNFQVEHHLFPRVSHIHYPAINQFVKETCREYNIAYNEYKTMFTAIASHLRHLHMMGEITPQQAEVS